MDVSEHVYTRLYQTFNPGVAGSTPARRIFFRIPLPHRRNNLYLYAKHRVGQTGAED